VRHVSSFTNIFPTLPRGPLDHGLNLRVAVDTRDTYRGIHRIMSVERRDVARLCSETLSFFPRFWIALVETANMLTGHSTRHLCRVGRARLRPNTGNRRSANMAEATPRTHHACAISRSNQRNRCFQSTERPSSLIRRIGVTFPSNVICEPSRYLGQDVSETRKLFLAYRSNRSNRTTGCELSARLAMATI